MHTLATMRRPFWRPFLSLFGAGLLGVVAIVPLALTAITKQLAGTPQEATLPPMPVLAALTLVQPALLVAGAVALGLALAPRLGLRSRIVDWAAGQEGATGLGRELLLAVGLGGALTLVALGLDALFRPWLPEVLWLIGGTPRTLATTLLGVFYGGITEEVLMRWGLMSLLAWGIWRLAQRGEGAPRPAVMWAAIIGAALLFGAGHLPAVAAATPLTAAVVARTLVINGLVGALFGWLFWRRSLEAAMAAHATFHIVATVVDWVVR